MGIGMSSYEKNARKVKDAQNVRANIACNSERTQQHGEGST